MIELALAQLGFTEKEIKVYLCILQHGKLTPVSIARLTSLNRTTVYAIANTLLKKGYLVEDMAEAIQTYSVRDPEIFAQYIKKEEAQLEEKKELVEHTIHQLKSMSSPAHYTIPKIIFVEEDKIMDHLYRQAPVWDKSIRERKTEYYGYQDASFVTHYKDWIEWYWQQESSKDISLKLISNEYPELLEGKTFPGRDVRFWANVGNLTASTWVKGDYIIMVVTNVRPHYLVEIYDRTMAHNMREVFKGIWKDIMEK